MFYLGNLAPFVLWKFCIFCKTDFLIVSYFFILQKQFPRTKLSWNFKFFLQKFLLSETLVLPCIACTEENAYNLIWLVVGWVSIYLWTSIVINSLGTWSTRISSNIFMYWTQRSTWTFASSGILLGYLAVLILFSLF